MPVNDRPDLGQIPTTPDDLQQPNRFGGITELVKDVFVLELRHFLKTDNTRIRLGEFPRIDKYSVALDVSVDPLETAVNMIKSYPDMTEDMPLVAVMSTSGNNLKLGMSDKHVGMAIRPATVIGGAGPFDLTDGSSLIIETTPTGKLDSATQSTFSFDSRFFDNIAEATLDEVIDAINFQALYVTAQKFVIGGSPVLTLRAGGIEGKQFPNMITIKGGTALTELGFTLNQTDKNYGTGKVAYSRHCISSTMTVGLEVVTESDNVRSELSDLIFDFFTFVMADRQFQFYGRSVFSEDILDETYQIIIKDSEISLAGEQETPRPGDSKDKIYVNRINVPVIAIQYTDRVIVDRSGQPVNPAISIVSIADETLPEMN